MNRLAVPTTLLLTALLALAPVAHARTPSQAARAGAAWLARAVPPGSSGPAADTVAALRAAGRLSRPGARARAAGLRRGARAYARTAGATGKVVLGLVAAGRNGRCAAGMDLLRRLGAMRRGGRYGRTAFDHTLAMLAVRALGHRVPRAAVRSLLRARGRGGWNFTLSRRSSDRVTETALAISALRAAGVSRRARALRSALRWLRAQRTPAGGFAHGRRDRNEANPTALAILSQRAMGVRDARATRALMALQRPDGAFQFTATDAGSRVLASVDAVVALSGRALPVTRLRSPARGC